MNYLPINETKDLEGELGVKDATCLLEGVHCQSWNKFRGEEGRP
jgi:hypothetical protein